jgi:hypothetical protein
MKGDISKAISQIYKLYSVVPGKILLGVLGDNDASLFDALTTQLQDIGTALCG